jgi:membrane-bound lytic murein transglycosylase B
LLKNIFQSTQKARLALAASLAIALLSACSTTTSTRSENIPSKVQEMSKESDKKPDSLAPFLAKLSQDHHIPLADLQNAFEDAKTIPSIKKLVLPPPPGFQKNWKVYRSRFVEPKRLAAGQQFWKKHQAFIKETSDKTGVPPEVIVSIIGVETIYGRNMGNFSVRDTLVTLGFQYPDTPNRKARETLFKNQLEDLVLLCWKENPKAKPFKACLNQNGSYAGAIGLPQFMPGSILRFAVDGDQDGKIDLRNSPQDAIASVANFLKAHGWIKNEPVYLELLPGDEVQQAAKELADGEPKAKIKLGEMLQKNMIASTNLPSETPSLVVDLPSPDGQGGTSTKYVVGLRNFIAICDYNRSFFYAQSVAEFAEVLKGEMPVMQGDAKQPSKKAKRTKKSSSKQTIKKKKD